MATMATMATLNQDIKIKFFTKGVCPIKEW